MIMNTDLDVALDLFADRKHVLDKLGWHIKLGHESAQMCWHCFWGWPKQVADIYHEALRQLDGDENVLCSGGGYIVWHDEQFGFAEEAIFFVKCDWRLTDEQKKIVIDSLQKLEEVPDEYKNYPDDYDGRNPKLFPPPEGWVMVKK